jgi:hypothetical protein
LKTAVESFFQSQRAGMYVLAAAGVVGVLLLLSIGMRGRREQEVRLAAPEAGSR